VLETQLKDEYDFDKPSTKTWIVTIEDKGSVSFPEELLQQLGWETGDDLEWFEIGDHEFLLVKIESP
jgi:bifunctional DNA-binding transcriptional regulator/antitoxin component of YhaV-PrlF toxin-antitoxin module